MKTLRKVRHSVILLPEGLCDTGKLFNVNLHSCKRTEFISWTKKEETPPFSRPFYFETVVR